MNSILNIPGKEVAVIVAHPDDEILWCGGLILKYPKHNWYIISLCRRSDPDRAPKFYKVLELLKAQGDIGDMDDGPEQFSLEEEEVKRIILELLPAQSFDLVITHDPAGEYTRHKRHEETGTAVIKLWNINAIRTIELWTFAYEDGGKKYYPKAIESASILESLPEAIWEMKFKLITEIYGFEPGSFEAETTPRTEAFWRFKKPEEGLKWLKRSQA
ncbi:PIG-L deacetylase family protein [Salegentibacter sediminis]|uniref:PIG-L deacetylase family protein n=1 Tax=Salegentibacter sediminis TaxID=1930251 RepID=UPI0009C05205|nr:PIG-L family deacetylase [Salegentibacter sediminis]